eukprot:15462723-Alexandrium_andersonii.AAC.1
MSNCAERTPRELRRPRLRPFLGPRSSRFERLKRVCIFRMADCGLRRIAALTGLGWIADCALGTLQCKDARLGAGRTKRGWPGLQVLQ